MCTFQGDWDHLVQKYLDLAEDKSWGDRNKLNPTDPGMYCLNEEQRDLVVAGADPEMKIYQRVKAEDEPLFRKIADHFGMEKYELKFHNQKTGQMLVWHIDNFASRTERENSFKIIDADKDSGLMRRFTVMLDDWHHGQIFAIGNSHWHQWKRGECITWEWQDMPHGTCNMGWDDRPMLQITGYVTDITQELLATADVNKLVIV